MIAQQILDAYETMKTLSISNASALTKTMKWRRTNRWSIAANATPPTTSPQVSVMSPSIQATANLPSPTYRPPNPYKK